MKLTSFKIVLLALVFIIGGIWAFIRLMSDRSVQKSCPEKNDGLFIAELGKEHIKPDASHPPYNSNPPTSGWHTEETAKWGISEAPVPDEMQVHNLEHGGIMIQYGQEISKEVRQKLEEITKQYKSKVLMAPRAGLDRAIALTAWTYLDKFDSFDECRINGFIKAHINQGPEFTEN